MGTFGTWAGATPYSEMTNNQEALAGNSGGSSGWVPETYDATTEGFTGTTPAFTADAYSKLMEDLQSSPFITNQSDAFKQQQAQMILDGLPKNAQGDWLIDPAVAGVTASQSAGAALQMAALHPNDPSVAGMTPEQIATKYAGNTGASNVSLMDLINGNFTKPAPPPPPTPPPATGGAQIGTAGPKNYLGTPTTNAPNNSILNQYLIDQGLLPGNPTLPDSAFKEFVPPATPLGSSRTPAGTPASPGVSDMLLGGVNQPNPTPNIPALTPASPTPTPVNPATPTSPTGQTPGAPSTPAYTSNSSEFNFLDLLEQLKQMYVPSPPSAGGTPDQALAYNAGDIGYLRTMAENGGLAFDTSPQWTAMVAAMQRNQDRQAADLAEKYNVSGNRFSTAFGNGMADFYNQATLNQNSLLAGLQSNSYESAMQRALQASGALGGYAQSGLQQLSSQDFQSQMQQQQQGLQAALAMLSAGSGAAGQLGQLGASGAGMLQSGAVTGAQNLFNAENQAALTNEQIQLALQQMGLGAANNLSQLWQSNLGLGSMLGGQNYSIQQDQLNRGYQEWLRTQPEYNPLLGYQAQGANTYPQLFQPQYPQSQLGSILGGIGGLAGLAPGLINSIAQLFNGGGGGGGGVNLGVNLGLGGLFGGGQGNSPYVWQYSDPYAAYSAYSSVPGSYIGPYDPWLQVSDPNNPYYWG